MRGLVVELTRLLSVDFVLLFGIQTFVLMSIIVVERSDSRDRGESDMRNDEKFIVHQISSDKYPAIMNSPPNGVAGPAVFETIALLDWESEGKEQRTKG